jgi:hypothetical protein
MSPRPTRRAFLVLSILILNNHIIGLSGTNWKQLLVSNLVSSVSIALFHSGIVFRDVGLWCDVEAHEMR